MPTSKAVDDATDSGKDALAGAKSGIDSAAKAIPEFARTAQKAVQDGVGQLRDQVDVDDLNRRFDDARGYVVDRVQDKPMTATLAALGAGFVLGLLFASRR